MDLSPGTNIGPYRLIEQIGIGGMASVYKAYHAAMDRHVALKILPQQFAKDATYMGRFHQEARTIANLEHPHILPVYDFGDDNGLTYLVMRLLETGTLKDSMSAGPLPIAELHHVFSQIAEALEYAHSRGVIHRDVKPSNVLIDPHGNAFLTDFGVAKLLEGTSQFTASGGLLGTPAYMAPEQGKGIPSDKRSDIYALGVVLYEMCTGRVPFDAETPLAIVLKHINDPLPLPRNLNPAIPSDVQNVILKALAKEPDERFQSTGEMLAAWQSAIGNLSQIDKPFGPDFVPPDDATHAASSPETAAHPPRAAAVQPLSEGAPSAPALPVDDEEVAPARRRLPRRRWLAIPALLLVCGCLGLLTLRSISQDRNQAAAVEGGASAITNEAAQTEEVPAAATEGLPDEGEPEQPQPTAVDRSNFGWETFGNKNDIRSAVPAGDLILTATGGGIVIWEPANDAFEVWDFNTGLPFSRVNSVMPQADGTVWIGTEFGLLRRNPDDSLAHYTPEDGLDSDFVGPVAIGSAGTVMVGTRYGERGLNVFRDGHWSAVDWPGVAEPDPSDLSVVSTQINGIYGDADGSLVITTDQGLAARDNGGWTILKAANGLPADNVIAFAADENGNVWIGTEFGAAHVDISTETLEPVPELEDGPVTAIFQDHNGTMWFGLTGRVASFNLENSDWEYFDEGDGLIGWEIRAIFEDEAGHLWIAGDDGLMQFTEGRFLEFRVPDQPAYSEFSYIVPDQDGDLLTGPFYWGGYAQYGREGGEFEFYELPGDATPMAVTDDGTIWAGSSYAGLWHIGFDNTERQYTTADGLPSDLITSVAVDEQGNVWAGTDAGLARLSPQDDHIEVFDVASGRLLHNYVQTVFVDSADRIWVGTDGGGAVFDGDEWFLLRPGDELHPDALAVYDFAEGPDGIIRIGTDSGGLAAYNPENDAWTQQRDNLPGESPIVVAVDPTDNTVWLAFPWEGVVAHQSGDDWEPLHDLRLADPRVNEIYIADSGEIFFATESGLTRWGP